MVTSLTQQFLSLASILLILSFHTDTKIPLENLWNGFSTTSLWFLSYLTSMFRVNSSQAFFKDACQEQFSWGWDIDAFIFKHNLEFKIGQEVVMAWNACACYGLKCMNMQWLDVHKYVTTLDAWASHGLECMSVSQLGWERIKFGLPLLLDVPKRFPFYTLVQMQFTLVSNSHG